MLFSSALFSNTVQQDSFISEKFIQYVIMYVTNLFWNTSKIPYTVAVPITVLQVSKMSFVVRSAL